MASGPQLPASQFGDSCCPNPERLDVAILLLVGFPRRCLRRLDLLLLTCCSRADLGWLGSFITDWSCWIDYSWSTDPAPKALRPYIGHTGTVISLLHMARWYSPLQDQSPRTQLGLFVLAPRLPLGVRWLGAFPLNLLWHVARRRVLLLRCGTSPDPKFTEESKVLCVPLFPFAHGTLTLPLKYLSPTSSSPNSLSPKSLSPNSFSPTSLSPNSHLRHAVTTR